MTDNDLRHKEGNNETDMDIGKEVLGTVVDMDTGKDAYMAEHLHTRDIPLIQQVRVAAYHKNRVVYNMGKDTGHASEGGTGKQ